MHACRREIPPKPDQGAQFCDSASRDDSVLAALPTLRSPQALPPKRPPMLYAISSNITYVEECELSELLSVDATRSLLLRPGGQQENCFQRNMSDAKPRRHHKRYAVVCCCRRPRRMPRGCHSRDGPRLRAGKSFSVAVLFVRMFVVGNLGLYTACYGLLVRVLVQVQYFGSHWAAINRKRTNKHKRQTNNHCCHSILQWKLPPAALQRLPRPKIENQQLQGRRQ